jgi:DNA-binding beta-propeller fold protein YncE
MGLFVSGGFADDAGGPYKIIKSVKIGGPGGMDYITVDSEARKLFVPRGDHMVAFDADTLAELGQIPNVAGEHGVAIDPKNGHGFISGRGAITVFDTATIKQIASVPVQGRPDGISFDPTSQRVYVASHEAPNLTVINAADNSIIGTVDSVGEGIEGCASDGKRLFCNLEGDSEVAVVDESTLKVTDHWKLGDGQGPTGIGLDAKNHRLFSMCGGNGRVVVLNTDTGAVVATLTCGAGADSGGFNPNTSEAFSANGSDGTLTVVKENTPDDIVVEQNVKTLPRARSCNVDIKNNQVYLAGFLYPPAANASTNPSAEQTQAAPGGAPAGGQARPGGRGRRVPPIPDSFTILIVGQ